MPRRHTMRERGTPDNFDSGTRSTLFIFRAEIDEDNPLHPGNDPRPSRALSVARHLGYLKSREDKIAPQSSGSLLTSPLLGFERNGLSKIFVDVSPSLRRSNVI